MTSYHARCWWNPPAFWHHSLIQFVQLRFSVCTVKGITVHRCLASVTGQTYFSFYLKEQHLPQFHHIFSWSQHDSEHWSLCVVSDQNTPWSQLHVLQLHASHVDGAFQGRRIFHQFNCQDARCGTDFYGNFSVICKKQELKWLLKI